MSAPVVIVGAGPAGVAAAVQLQRSRIAFRLLEKERVGGLLNEANRVENFPGVPGGVGGRILAKRLEAQLRTAGAPVAKQPVLGAIFRDDRFTLTTDDEVILADRLILACGTRPLAVPPPLDCESLRADVFTGIIPLLRTRKKIIAIIGGGDAAFDYALSLAGKNEVHILIRAGRPRALPLLVEHCRRHANIVIHENCRLTYATKTPQTAGIILKTTDSLTGKSGEITCHRILTAIGREPALDFLDPELRAALPELAKLKKLFLAGDVANGRFRQAAIAAAAGLRIAMEIAAGGNGCA